MFNIVNQVKTLVGIKGNGYKTDGFDARDVLFTSKFAAVHYPEKVNLLQDVVRVKDQQATGSCVGQSIANAVRIAYLQDNKPAPDLSALFVYYNARFEENTPKIIDDGCRIRLAMKAVMKFGICPESNWAFSVAKANTRPDHWAYRYGASQRGIRGYYRIEKGDISSIKRALATGKPIVAGWDLSNTFGPKDGIVDRQVNGTAGHAMCIYGYDGDKFNVLNSWGQDWGVKGAFLGTSSFIADARDLWAIDV